MIFLFHIQDFLVKFDRDFQLEQIHSYGVVPCRLPPRPQLVMLKMQDAYGEWQEYCVVNKQSGGFNLQILISKLE